MCIVTPQYGFQMVRHLNRSNTIMVALTRIKCREMPANILCVETLYSMFGAILQQYINAHKDI